MALNESAFGPIRSTLQGIGGLDSFLVINGGSKVAVIPNSVTRTRDYEFGGQQEDVTRSAVCLHSEFVAAYPDPAKDYLGKLATLDGENYRVSSISTQADGNTMVELEGEQQAP